MIYLTVPFKDKDIVKYMGARWDYSKRRWYITDDMSRERFFRWIKDEPVSSTLEVCVDKNHSLKSIEDDTLVSAGSKEESVLPIGAPLSSLLFEISEIVRKGFAQLRWTVAEIASVRRAVSGHYYLELVEHDKNGKEIAKVSARIWSNNSKIIKSFEQQTQTELAIGMKILALVNVELSVQYGFSLVIEQLNASWTLGEMELARRKIREQLLEKGLWDLNKNKIIPRDFSKIAVIAPEGAAGLGDFMIDAKKVENAGLCSFDVFFATFEGVGARESLLSAFKSAEAKNQTVGYDVFVVIRGGGASASLNWLNDFSVAKALVESSVAVFTGIGHERDDTILDEVSAKRFDTPSKVIGFIEQTIIQNALNANAAFNDVLTSADRQLLVVKTQSQRQLEIVKNLSQKEIDFISTDSRSIMENVFSQIEYVCKRTQEQSQMLMKQVLGLGPSGVLSRGYVVVKQADNVITSKDMMENGAIELSFFDGKVRGQIVCEK